ncbi:MAG: DUF4872 domain-containing protein [Armatimonadota bacterium]
MQVESYVPRAGIQFETGGLANIVAGLGVVSPRTGEPFTEGALIGLGGGIGGGYMLFEMCGEKYVVTGFRRDWQKYKGEFSETVCARLGVGVEICESGGVKKAEADLRAALDAGRPAWVTAAEAALPHRGLPVSLAKGLVYGLVVFGHDGDTFYAHDVCAAPVELSAETLRFARSVITSNKNRLLLFSAPAAPLTPAALAEATLEAIRQCAHEMLNPPIKNFGVTAWQKWGGMAANLKDKKGWPTVLAEERHLRDGMRTLYESVIQESGDTGGLRGLYAAFLDDAASQLDRPALARVAEQYRDLEQRWRDLFAAILPESHPVLSRIRAGIEERHRLLRSGDPNALPELQRLRSQQESLVAEGEPTPPEARQELFEGIAGRLKAIYSAELEAAQSLQAAAS